MNEKVLPVDSLWEAGTKIVSSIAPIEEVRGGVIPDIILSLIILIFFVGLIVFSREILSVIPSLLKSTLNLKEHFKLEEKLSLSNMRNVVFVVSLVYFPVIVTIMAGRFIESQFGTYPPLFLIICFGIIIILGVVKKLIILLLSWLNKDSNTFSFLEKVGFNHIIIAAIVTFPSLLLKLFIEDGTGEIVVYTMIISIIPIFILYLIRSYQIIIGQQYSHFFYILYLCGAEILPIVLIVHFILSL
ncbi:MAG: DUF4271 domain-containing protein [Bacteroidales bacterium]|nr:DUF4271 domain-containing protein [Bacteroidales bacterium]